MTSPIPTEGGHTPGPWFQDEAGICAASEDGGEIVAMVCVPEVLFGVADDELPEVVVARLQANARLIAAAPAMLEALQGLTHGLPELLESIGYTDEEGLIDEALAVIAQATGGEDVRR